MLTRVTLGKSLVRYLKKKNHSQQWTYKKPTPNIARTCNFFLVDNLSLYNDGNGKVKVAPSKTMFSAAAIQA